MQPNGSGAPNLDQSWIHVRIHHFPPPDWWPLWGGDWSEQHLRQGHWGLPSGLGPPTDSRELPGIQLTSPGTTLTSPTGIRNRKGMIWRNVQQLFPDFSAGLEAVLAAALITTFPDLTGNKTDKWFNLATRPYFFLCLPSTEACPLENSTVTKKHSMCKIGLNKGSRVHMNAH